MEHHRLLVVVNDDVTRRKSSSLFTLSQGHYYRHHQYHKLATSWLTRLFQRASQQTTENKLIVTRPSCPVNTCSAGNKSAHQRNGQPIEISSSNGGPVHLGQLGANCRQSHSTLNWAIMDDYNSGSLRRPLAYTAVIHQQDEHEQSVSGLAQDQIYQSGEDSQLNCCCMHFELNQPKDYKFYLLVSLLIIGLCLVTTMAFACVMIYFDNDDLIEKVVPTTNAIPMTEASMRSMATQFTLESPISTTWSRPTANRGAPWIVRDTLDDSIGGRTGSKRRQQQQQTGDNDSNYETTTRGVQIGDANCVDECKHHAKCGRSSASNSNSPPSSCYCPTTCDELLKTISIHHIDDMEAGLFGSPPPTITKKQQQQQQEQQQSDAIVGQEQQLNNDINVTLRDTRPSRQSHSSDRIANHMKYPLCGTDGNDYSTLCQLFNASCTQQIDIRVKSIGSCKSCHHINCRHYARCQMSDNRVPHCVCPRDCDSVMLEPSAIPATTNSTFTNTTTLCATNSVSYANECQMRQDSCRLQESLSVAYIGECDKCRNVSCERGRYCKEGRCVCEDRCQQGATRSHNGASALTPEPSGQQQQQQQKQDDAYNQSICANDGNTYRNQCELLRFACLNSLDLRPLFYGSCDDRDELFLARSP